jgi:hypothetical protein
LSGTEAKASHKKLGSNDFFTKKSPERSRLPFDSAITIFASPVAVMFSLTILNMLILSSISEDPTLTCFFSHLIFFCFPCRFMS